MTSIEELLAGLSAGNMQAPQVNASQLMPGVRMVRQAPISPMQQIPQQTQGQPSQQDYDLGQYMKNVVREAIGKQMQNRGTNDSVVNILKQRLEPTDADVAKSITQTAQSFANPQQFKQASPQDVASQRLESEMTPYSMQMKMQGEVPASVREYQYFNSLPQDAQQQYLTLKRQQQFLNTGGSFIDPRTGQVIQKTLSPENLPENAYNKAYATNTGQNAADVIGKPVIAGREAQARLGAELSNAAQIEAEKGRGKALTGVSSDLASLESKMPDIEAVVSRLHDLGQKATYTTAGRAIDTARKEVGMLPRESAVARSEYISTVDNQIMPLLRDTFGAQFTEREGVTLRATLGDPNKTPQEKDAVLRAFINQKYADVRAMRRQQSQLGAPQIQGAASMQPPITLQEPTEAPQADMLTSSSGIKYRVVQ